MSGASRLGWRGAGVTLGEVPALARPSPPTSENPLEAKFAECAFHALGCIKGREKGRGCQAPALPTISYVKGVPGGRPSQKLCGMDKNTGSTPDWVSATRSQSAAITSFLSANTRS